MFLVSFSQWFYELISGIGGFIIDDIFITYRILAWGTVSVVFMVAVFWILAMIQECPDTSGDRPGLFAYMDCNLYWRANKLLTGQQPPQPSPEPTQN